MSKTITTAMKAHVAQEATTLCTIWEITRVDGMVLRFTDLDVNLVVGGNTYVAAIGYNRSAITNQADMSVDNLDVDGILDSAMITVAELRAGLYDYATVKIWLVNWETPAQGPLAMRRGWFGEVTTLPSGKFKTELRGLNQVFQQIVGRTYDNECDADLGDSRCKIDLVGGGWNRNGSVVAATSRRNFTATITSPDPRASDATWYVGGVLTWLTGPNAGRNIEVKTWTPGTTGFELFLSMPYAIGAGDTFTIRPGCDKKGATCKNKFANKINFRGFEYIPGSDQLMQYPDPQ